MSTERIVNLMEEYKQHEVQFVNKSKKWKGWHRLVPLFFYIVGMFKPELMRSFFNDYLNVLGKTVYLPHHLYMDYAVDPSKFFIEYEGVLRHELQHIKDWKKEGIKFPIGYIAKKELRAYYEYRANVQNMIVRYLNYGTLDESYVVRIENIFKSEMYFKMDLDPKYKIKAIKDNIESGKLRFETYDAVIDSVIKRP